MEITEKKLTITLQEKLLGTIPKDPEVYKAHVAKKIADTEGEEIPFEEERGWTGFYTDSEGIFLYDYQIKGFIKESANVLKDQVKVKALRSKIDNVLFLSPRKIRLQKAPDGVIERPLRAMTMQGPRVTLARSDYINEGKELTITLKLLKNKEVTWEIIDELMKYGELKGLGQFRNGGYGSFTYRLD